MNRKLFIWLLLATTAVVILGLILPGNSGRESNTTEAILIPGLEEQVNTIEWLRLSAGDSESVVTLKRNEGRWVVEEASAYRADWNVVKTLLGSLAQAEIVEQKTTNPDLYSRLGVEDISQPGATGVLVEFAEGSGLPALVLGNQAQGRDGQYARLAGSGKSVLINPVIDVPRAPNDWLDREIIDISDAEVVEYEISRSGQASVRAIKASADDENFELENVPGNREIVSEWGVNAPANALAALELQAALPADQFNWDDATRLRILTADGLLVETQILSIKEGKEDGYPPEQWIRLQAGVYSAEDRKVASEAVPPAETTQRAEQLNNRFQGWAYRIPAYRIDSMTRTLEDLLKPASEEHEPSAL